VITLAKLTPERSWLAKASSVALVQAANDARRAYLNKSDACGGGVRPPLAVAAAGETGTHRSAV
jgi:hypothetical protein